tara:strand:+ start:831 stop:1244 length:414 start_codon:yes stop_codon:yes gene_type:complete
MCFFKAPSIQMPTVQYVGPSQEEIDAQNTALTNFQNTLTANNQTFQTNIQNQITKANEATADLMTKISTMNTQTAQLGGAGGLTDAPYAITSEDNVDPTELAQTTTTIKKKDKPKGSLKITQSGIQSAAGAGVNYGV